MEKGITENRISEETKQRERDKDREEEKDRCRLIYSKRLLDLCFATDVIRDIHCARPIPY